MAAFVEPIEEEADLSGHEIALERKPRSRAHDPGRSAEILSMTASP
ncbi:MAG: hypothetical protein RIB52_00045 [Erythrobacter sp.]